MKSMTLILLIVVLLITACQSAPSTPTSEPVVVTEEPAVVTEGPQEQIATEEPYPYPPQPFVTAPSGDEGYPSPQGQTVEGFSGESAYPVPGAEGATLVNWEEAQNLILKGEVAQVTQLHNLTVFLTLKDGNMVQTVEPNIDDVFDVVDQCGDPCSDIIIATE